MKIKKQKAQKIEISSKELEARKKYKINLLKVLIYAIVIESYFVALNFIKESNILENFSTFLKISYTILIFVAVILLEIAYKKDKKDLMITGLEIGMLAVHTLLIAKVQTQTSQGVNILEVSYIWPIYYCLKALIIHTKENQRKLRQILDINEIIKEEKPTKKVAKKRKT